MFAVFGVLLASCLKLGILLASGKLFVLSGEVEQNGRIIISCLVSKISYSCGAAPPYINLINEPVLR